MARGAPNVAARTERLKYIGAKVEQTAGSSHQPGVGMDAEDSDSSSAGHRVFSDPLQSSDTASTDTSLETLEIEKDVPSTIARIRSNVDHRALERWDGSSLPKISKNYPIQRFVNQSTLESPWNHYIAEQDRRVHRHNLLAKLDILLWELQHVTPMNPSFNALSLPPTNGSLLSVRPPAPPVLELMGRSSQALSSRLQPSAEDARRIGPDSDILLLLSRDKQLQIQFVYEVSFLILFLGCVNITFMVRAHTATTQKRKYDGHQQPPQKRIKTTLQASGSHQGICAGSSSPSITPQPILDSCAPQRACGPDLRLADIFYKFDPVKYVACVDIGCVGLHSLFRDDKDKHLHKAHVDKHHMTYPKLLDISSYDPRNDATMRDEVPDSREEMKAFKWRAKFVRAFPSFRSKFSMLNPYYGLPLLPPGYDNELKQLQLCEYGRYRAGDPAALMRDPSLWNHVLNCQESQPEWFYVLIFCVALSSFVAGRIDAQLVAPATVAGSSSSSKISEPGPVLTPAINSPSHMAIFEDTLQHNTSKRRSNTHKSQDTPESRLPRDHFEPFALHTCGSRDDIGTPGRDSADDMPSSSELSFLHIGRTVTTSDEDTTSEYFGSTIDPRLMVFGHREENDLKELEPDDDCERKLEEMRANFYPPLESEDSRAACEEDDDLYSGSPTWGQ
ncbi:hypothetical protein LTR10_021777 [Elasticomyces elasticus]|uniref:Uncharacterized protein n=1 Tax=Exophiala sideris TaxID=1016849 RepID=A0ABR0J5Y9_9EURO|nr:hypothetical protein LTR10_021777 [Elasticomyces elasticus]KAK5028715.1 hypothetical protein LTS07_006094 [Exophiala sideris]KAK5035583.1 hypothetical protein LTR13_005712 [Exophiala sideris]KAK5057219.1 hypothetical protein LTR69_007258 [Exophiala sideris]KAK5181808.1 hypothetical protein LTR44_006008 [Eurotiomycetes sp. CCFEE 6388]